MSDSGVHRFDPALQLSGALDQAPGALTLVDLEGRLLYYNAYAATFLDRRPEYLGRDIRELHGTQSAAKISRILAETAAGARETWTWRLKRDGREFAVRVAPWRVEGRAAGLLHLVIPL